MQPVMQFFDSHCHFDFAVFDAERAQLWRECAALGIDYLLLPGVAPEQWPNAASIAQAQGIYYSVGLHPHWLKADVDLTNLQQQLAQHLAQHSAQAGAPHKCLALGECGLDAAIATPMHLQQAVLDIHLQRAQEQSLPLIIHCRSAHNELLRQLKSYRLPAGGVIHAFSGSYELAMGYWAMGFRLGIGGTITYARANKTRMAVKKLPLEAMLLETDAPDMPLYGRQGERNSPLQLIDIAQTLADLRAEPLAQIAAQTTLNSRTLFKINDECSRPTISLPLP